MECNLAEKRSAEKTRDLVKNALLNEAVGVLADSAALKQRSTQFANASLAAGPVSGIGIPVV
jgi:hypothetical protein